MSRVRVRAILDGGTDTVAVPLGLAPAARIAERDWHEFLTDPTQLANGLRDLVDAVRPDGVPVSNDDELLHEIVAGLAAAGPHRTAAQEGTRRLRQSLGDQVALVGVLPGPNRVVEASGMTATAATAAVQECGQGLLAAGVDILLVCDEGAESIPLSTLGNMARFHRALALALGEPASGLPRVAAVPLDEPVPTPGVVVTAGNLARETDFSVLEDWLVRVRG